MGKKKAKLMGKDGKSEPGDYIVNLLTAGDDRNCVLVGCGFIEHCLEMLLRKHFLNSNPGGKQLEGLANKVFDGSKDNIALLQSGWSKAAIACLLGLMSQRNYSAFGKIRTMRNTCAHHPGHVEFDKQSVDQVLNMLGTDAVADFLYWEERASNGVFWWKDDQGKFSITRRKFMYACQQISSDLRTKAQEIDPDIPWNQMGLVLG